MTAVAALVLPASVLVPGAAPAGAAGAPVGPDQPAHWGSYFGGSTSGTVLVPKGIRLPAPATEVATSNSTEYALLDDGAVYAWGLGTNGELGDGATGNSLSAAVRVAFPAGVFIVSLPTDAMPYDTAMAVDSNGNAWGWGLNSQGQLCLGDTAAHLRPTRLPFADVTTLAGAGDHALYDADGSVYACGGNHQGDLGVGDNRGSTSPVPVPGLSGSVVKSLVASFNNSGALLTDGVYLDWGLDRAGQLGDGRVGRDWASPVVVRLPLPVTQVALGGSWSDNGQTLVMLSDGSLRGWGDDGYGQLGDGGTGYQRLPVQVFPPAGVTYALLASGGSTSYAVSTTGNVYSWGADDAGQLGDGGRTASPTPTLVESGADEVSATAQNVDVGDDATAPATTGRPAPG